MLIKRDITYGKGKKAFPVQTIAFFDLPALLSTVALFDSHDSGGAKSYFNRTSNFTGASKTATIDALTNGAPAAAVAKSDKMLADFEQVIRVETSRFETVNAVAGGVANVPAFLAGHPMAMRQRRRVDSALGPADCTGRRDNIRAHFGANNRTARNCCVGAHSRACCRSPN
jgi:hypothetical protein